MSESEELARLELQAKSMAEKMVREKVEEHKNEIEKRRELEGLHHRPVLAWEHAKQEKHHLTEVKERLKQELRSVKIQLSKQPGSYPNGYSLGTLSWGRYNAFLRLLLSLYRIFISRPIGVGTTMGWFIYRIFAITTSFLCAAIISFTVCNILFFCRILATTKAFLCEASISFTAHFSIRRPSAKRKGVPPKFINKKVGGR